MKHYIVTLDVYMEDDEDQTKFMDLDLGNIDTEAQNGNIKDWAFREVENVTEPGE